MQQAHYIICDSGDGSQSISWYKGSQFTAEELVKHAEHDEYESYASGDGVQLTTLEFPDSLDLDQIRGITWETKLPGDYDSEQV